MHVHVAALQGCWGPAGGRQDQEWKVHREGVFFAHVTWTPGLERVQRPITVPGTQGAAIEMTGGVTTGLFPLSIVRI